ncbi:unnamed protein product [Vicia faba]|uniref:Uncharacterized protein n=1 Tax=Vicia faba TaxID=3906 RepID=A0AAV0YXW8_VICFA|nr:unnamed protein product [Vicia faba]
MRPNLESVDLFFLCLHVIAQSVDRGIYIEVYGAKKVGVVHGYGDRISRRSSPVSVGVSKLSGYTDGGSGQTGEFPLLDYFDAYADSSVDGDCFDSEPIDYDVDVEMKS